MSDRTKMVDMGTLKHLLDRPIAYQRAYCRLGCGITGALLLSQAVYWQLRVPNDGDPRHRDGWWWHTQSEWHEDTGLTRAELVTARARLVRLGVLEYRRMGIPARGFYRVDFDCLLSSLQDSCKQLKNNANDRDETKIAGIHPSESTESCDQDQRELGNSAGEILPAKQRSPQTPKEQQHAAALHGRKRDQLHHGVVYWEDYELAEIEGFVRSYGASMVETVAAAVTAAKKIPYRTVMRGELARRHADAAREAARSQRRVPAPQDAAVEARRMVQYMRSLGREPTPDLMAQAGPGLQCLDQRGSPPALPGRQRSLTFAGVHRRNSNS